MRSTIVRSTFGLVFLLILSESLISSATRLNFTSDLTRWIEVPENSFREITTNPFFGNSCNWNVTSFDGNPTAFFSDYTRWSSESEAQGVIPGHIQRVANGWLTAFNQGSGGEVYWYSAHREERQLIAKTWISQFSEGDSPKEVFASERSPDGAGKVLRFWLGEDGELWKVEDFSEFQFGDVFGLAYGWRGGLLVFSDKGWWNVTLNRDVKQIHQFDDLFVSGGQIATKDESVFVGGEHFVTRIDFADKTLTKLCPSAEFLTAMKSWPSRMALTLGRYSLRFPK